MEFKKNVKELDIQLHEPKTNPPPAPIQHLDDSETNESSQKCKTDFSEKKSSIDHLSINFKKSIGFFQKKNLYMEDIDTNIYDKKRKYSMEEKLVIKKDFVPQLRPIEIHLVPSKLRLNKKGFKDLKCNKDNKILLMSNNYFISCPNSEEEEEEESEIEFSPKEKSNKENIKSTRKILQKMKSGTLPKVLSRNLIEPSCNIFKEEMKIDYESEKDSFESKEDENYINNDNLLLYDDDDFIQYKKEEKDDEDKKEEKDDKKNKEEKDGKHNVRSNRINSCSILDVLKNRFSFDESI
jgi:hypothetical protein